MSNKMLALDTCAQCGSLDVYLQWQPAMIDKYGSVMRYTLECRECGKVTLQQLPEYKNNDLVYSTTETPAKTKMPFEGLDKKELEEMMVAVELLLEHPATVDYVTKLQADLRAALDKE